MGVRLCRKCGQPFDDIRCRPCAVRYAQKWRLENPDRAKGYKRVGDAAWRAANPEKVAQYRAAWRARNRTRIHELNIQSSKNLSDCYLAALMKIPVRFVPKSLIEAKRVNLQITRFLKEEK